MATVTKTYRGEYNQATFALTFSNAKANLNVTDSSFYVTDMIPTVSAKITYSGLAKGTVNFYGTEYIGGNPIGGSYINYFTDDRTAWANNASKTIQPYIPDARAQYTSAFFNASTKTQRVLPLTFNGSINTLEALTSDNYMDHLYSGTVDVSLSQTITLDVPPTFSETFSYIDDYSGVPYAGRTTAKIQLSSLHAYYGGDFSGVGKAEFTIGGTTVSKANPANLNVLSIPLNSVGTFTPIVKVTDSRGQVATHTLPAITVKGYVSPSVSYGVERTTSTGVPNDEGVYTVIDPTFTFTDDIATLSAPSIVVTDDSGVAQTVSTTWYSSRAGDGTLSGSVTWESLSSGDTVYGLVSITGDFNTQKSYQIAVTPEDSIETGTTVTQTIGAAFYTVDFLAGGHGIAFGKPASNVGFECAMEATFEDTLQADGTATFGADVLIDLPEYQTASTTDKAIYDAVVALGWDSDVLIS